MSDDVEQIAAAELRSFIERLEKIDEEAKAVKDDRKDILGEAKNKGYNTKIISKIIALRKKTKDERDQEDSELDTYLRALDMI
jgi:uncharacterized protein (UPF0335 family)